MTRREMRRENTSAQADLVAIMKHPVNMNSRPTHIEILKITPTSVFYFGNVSIHHHELGPAHLLSERATCGMIVMRMANQNNFDVRKAKSKLLNTAAD